MRPGIVLIQNVGEEVVVRRHMAGILEFGAILLIKNSRQRVRQVVSVRVVRNVTDRPRIRLLLLLSCSCLLL